MVVSLGQNLIIFILFVTNDSFDRQICQNRFPATQDQRLPQTPQLEDYEREILYPLATKQIGIDLDDGVKVNYPKFGQALKKVAGLS